MLKEITETKDRVYANTEEIRDFKDRVSEKFSELSLQIAKQVDEILVRGDARYASKAVETAVEKLTNRGTERTWQVLMFLVNILVLIVLGYLGIKK